MAYTSIHSIKATDWAALDYITRNDKTVDDLYVQSYACRADSAGASEDFRAVRANGTGRTQILAYHLIQSFEPGEITPEQALAIAEELCDRFLKGDYQYVLAVHSDRKHIHAHVIFNNTNLYSGLSFTTEHNQGKKSERAWAELRQISDEICKENGLSVISQPKKGQGVSYYEYAHQKVGTSWKDKLRTKIAEVAFYSRDFQDFLQKCTESDIEYVYKPQNKVKLKFRLSGEGQQKFTRADTLGVDFTTERIAEQIAEIQKVKSVTERLAEKKKPEKAVALSKLEPDNVSTVITAEKFINNGKTTEPITPKPTESKPPEKKEDVWAEIRGIRNADQMIADLEAGGITSLADLRSFFWNIHHDDDYTDELADLKAHIKTVETIIAKMKHRDELVPIYKEYKSKSGWVQSRYKKKHATEIEDFEQTRTYIKQHSMKYTSDSSIPSLQDMQGLLKRMKDKRDKIFPEHKAFLAKKKVANQYTRAVRNYRDQHFNKRAAEQSRQRKLDQKRKRDTLE